MTGPPGHPLDPLTAEEIKSVAALIRKTREGDTTCTRYIFNSIALKEPAKDVVVPGLLSGTPPQFDPLLHREALVILVDRPTGQVHEITVDLTTQSVARWETPALGLQPTQHPLEMLEAEKIIAADKRVIEACRQLGIDDMAKVYVDPWAVGYHSTHKGKRLMQALMYMRNSPDDNQYSHPLDFTPIYDVNAQEVVEIIPHVPRNSRFDKPTVPLANHPFLPEHLGQEALRKDLKPVEITQPEGVSFQIINGHEIAWQKWKLHVGFNYREGVVINHVFYDRRPLFYRISLSEMVVPYANPYEPYNHKMAFDVGEYGLGNMSNSLSLGCDCVGSIYYMDGIIADLEGEPSVIPNAICIHEEDHGLLFKHTDYRTGKAHSARSRRLVISNIITAANYDYGLYYYFYQDGSFEYEVKATGELNTHVLAEDEDPAPYGTIVAPQVVAQHHQHLFCMRIDPMLDGLANSVVQVDVCPSPAPVGHPDNLIGNAFMPITTPLSTTDNARASAAYNRFWKIINEAKIHPYTNQPVGYKIVCHNTPPILAPPDALVTGRAAFSTHTLWVTPYAENALYPAGFYCNQSDPGLMGLPVWTTTSQDVKDKDIVLWLTFGLTHIPRVEDFPIMPVESSGFHLKPCNFFLGNPAIDIPPSSKLSTKSACAAPDCAPENRN